MIGWLRRARQTRTDVTGAASQSANRRMGELAAYRVTLAAQMTAQLVLWVTLQAYGKLTQTAWQAVCMQLLPLSLLLALWSRARGGFQAKAARYALLALLPCLVADAAVLAAGMDAMMGEMIPSYSPHARVIVVGGLGFLCALSGGKNGVAYGVGALRYLLAALFLLATVFLGADVSPARLWPLMGRGIGFTATTALSGVGCVWGVGLLYALPTDGSAAPQSALRGRKRPRAAFWAFAPLAVAIVWALWYGMARAWRDIDILTMGEKMMGLARNSRSILLCELAGFWWLVLLPCALAGCLMSGEKLLRFAFPKLPRFLAVLALALPAAVFAFFCGDESLSWLTPLLPYRAALSAAAGVALWVMGKGTRA